jgi:hypothetical protein
MFFGVITAHVVLTQLYSSSLVGLLLPTGSAVICTLAIAALSHSIRTFYFEPKRALLQLFTSAEGQANVVPPLLGDIEAIYGYLAAFFALIVRSAATVATIVEAMLALDSTALGNQLGRLVARRGNRSHRHPASCRAMCCSKACSEVRRPVAGALGPMSALELVYLHSLGGTGYVAPVMAMCIGCVRAVTFGDATAIVWLDVSPTVWRVLLAQLASQIAADAAVRAVKKMGLHQFELSAHFAAGHPLSNTAFRAFGLEGYALVFGPGWLLHYDWPVTPNLSEAASRAWLGWARCSRRAG